MKSVNTAGNKIFEMKLLLNEVRNYLTERQVSEVEKAFLFAQQAHGNQTRHSGDPYITHPVAVATILAAMRLDDKTIIAAILHDVLEDTDAEREQLKKNFGREVLNLVDGVTKLEKIRFETRVDAQAENFRKMMLAVAKDIRVILIKLADRLHNMRTLEHLQTKKRQRIAYETLEIYAPIANRLGMHSLVIEFEDISFATLYPRRYQVLQQEVKRSRGNQKDIVTTVEKALTHQLKKAKLHFSKLCGRKKNLYSVYRKMRDKKLHFSEIMDVYAFRIVVDDINSCYQVLGLVHSVYKPVPERFKDFIAIPKANGYQSLHTTLFGPLGMPLEIQIRSSDMDRLAETGIAAHWLYKSRKVKQKKPSSNYAHSWIQDLLQIQQNAGDSSEFIENIKTNLSPDEVYAFTPQGEIIKLPSNSTVVDFAYAVHSEVGNNCVTAKINNRLVSLSTILHNGQTVEIITAPSARPNINWLNFVVTGKARSAIHHFFKKQQKLESVQLGQHLLTSALTKEALSLDQLKLEELQSLLSELKLTSVDELFEQIGLGNQMAPFIARRFANQNTVANEGEQNLESATDSHTLSVKSAKGMALKFAKCCYPIPGDPISGILTMGRGVIIHHTSCQQFHALQTNKPSRCVHLCWEKVTIGHFEVSVDLEVINQRGVLAKIAQLIADADSNIIDFQVKGQDEKYSLDTMVITVKDGQHLTKIIRSLNHLSSVIKVARHT